MWKTRSFQPNVFSHRGYFGTTIWFCCLPLFRAYEFSKLSIFRFWGEVSKMHGPTAFLSGQPEFVTSEQLIHHLWN